MDEGGLDTEACYPYQGQQNNCSFNPKPPCCGSTVGGYVNVTSGSEAALQQAVFLVPVATAVDAEDQGFEFYTGGVYYDPNCSSSMIDHGITVVGYGHNSTVNMDTWILKNSWGAEWGMEGMTKPIVCFLLLHYYLRIHDNCQKQGKYVWSCN